MVVLAHKQRDYQAAPEVVAHGRGAGRSWPVQRLVGAEIWRFGLKDALVNPESGLSKTPLDRFFA